MKVIFVITKAILSRSNSFCPTKVTFVMKKIILSQQKLFCPNRCTGAKWDTCNCVLKSIFVLTKVRFVPTKIILYANEFTFAYKIDKNEFCHDKNPFFLHK